jgi:3-hydroxyisobutyrate dehydrogenase
VLLDAPVTGSRAQAETGELRFLVGGDAWTLDQVRPVLGAMGKTILHLGPLGAGACMKLVNNFMCGVQAASLAEGLTLVERAGIDRELALTVLREGAPGSPLVKTVSARMAAKDYTVNFKLGLMRKDLAYAIDEAQRRGLTLDTARTAKDMFDVATEEWAEADFAAVIETLRAGQKSEVKSQK